MINASKRVRKGEENSACVVLASSGGVSMLGWLGRVGVLRIGMLMSTQKMFLP
jgi:hypothetical protein